MVLWPVLHGWRVLSGLGFDRMDSDSIKLAGFHMCRCTHCVLLPDVAQRGG